MQKFNLISQRFCLTVLTPVILFSCKKEIKEKNFSNSSVQSNFSADHPNVILINIDDMGMEIPGFNGGRSFITPNLDNIAALSINFMQARAMPVCSPSRVQMITGKYNFRNYTGWAALDSNAKTIANVLKDAGYVTCLSGKWDIASIDLISKFGFDAYMTSNHNESEGNSDTSAYHIYKDPIINENGTLLPDTITKGKYGEDFFKQFVFDFIDSNTTKPFFIYWAPNLVHKPFSPTPDDPEFATWNPDQQASPGDTAFYGSMVKYVDKEIGELFSKITTSSIADRTIIIITADNGTSNDIYSTFDGKRVEGGKGTTLETGLRVPLLFYWQGNMVPQINKTLVDNCDLLPTIAELTNTSAYLYECGIIDGISFVPQISGTTGITRTWSFGHFQPRAEIYFSPIRRWVLDGTYKRYDSAWKYSVKTGFYKITGKNYLEANPIPYSSMTPYQLQLNQQFINVLSTMHN